MFDLNDIDIFLKNASESEIEDLSNLVMSDFDKDDGISESLKFAEEVYKEFYNNGLSLDDDDISTIAELAILVTKNAGYDKVTYVDILDKFYSPTTISQKIYDKETNEHVDTVLEEIEDVTFESVFEKLKSRFEFVIDNYKGVDEYEERFNEIQQDLLIIENNSAQDINENEELKNKFLSIAEKYKKTYPELNVHLEADDAKYKLNYFESIFNEFANDIIDGLYEVSNMINALDGKYFYKDYAVITLYDKSNYYVANFVIRGLCDKDEKGNEVWDFSKFAISEVWGDKDLIENFKESLERLYKEEGVLPYVQNNKDTYVNPNTGERYKVEVSDPINKNRFYGTDNYSGDKLSFIYRSVGLQHRDDQENEQSFARSDLLKPQKVKYKTKMVSSNFFRDIEGEVDKESLKKYRTSLDKKKKQLSNIKNSLRNVFRYSNKEYKSDSLEKIQKRIENGEFTDEQLLSLYKSSLENAGVGTDVESLFDASNDGDERSYIKYPIIEEIYKSYEDVDGDESTKELDVKGGMVESIKTIQTDLVDYLQDIHSVLQNRIKMIPQFLSDFKENFGIVSSSYSQYVRFYQETKKDYEKYRPKIDEDDIKLQQKGNKKEETNIDTNSNSYIQTELLSVAQRTYSYIDTFDAQLKKAIEHVKKLQKKYRLPELSHDKKYIIKTIGDMHDPTFDDFEYNVTVNEIVPGVSDYTSVKQVDDKSSATDYYALLNNFKQNVTTLKKDLKNHIRTPGVQDAEKGYKDVVHDLREKGTSDLRELQSGKPSEEHENLIQEHRKNIAILNDLANKRKELEELASAADNDDTKNEINNQLVELDALQEKYSNRNKEISIRLQEMIPSQEMDVWTGKDYSEFKKEKGKGSYVSDK